MTVTDPTAIKFSNDVARHMADLLSQVYYEAKFAEGECDSKGMSAFFTEEAGDIEDGSGTDKDKRTMYTSSDFIKLRKRWTDLISDLEANSNTKLKHVQKPAVNLVR